MATASGTGLRERKRAETRARLEAAAVSLVLSKGLENTTVEDISELADVSPRTFFNYFESKDQAILGVLPHDVSLPELAEPPGLRLEQELVPSVIGLVFATLGAPSTAVALREDRDGDLPPPPAPVGQQADSDDRGRRPADRGGREAADPGPSVRRPRRRRPAGAGRARAQHLRRGRPGRHPAMGHLRRQRRRRGTTCNSEPSSSSTD